MLSVVARTSGGPRYRLLDTTRAFAGSLLDSLGELDAVSADQARLQLEIFHACRFRPGDDGGA